MQGPHLIRGCQTLLGKTFRSNNSMYSNPNSPPPPTHRHHHNHPGQAASMHRLHPAPPMDPDGQAGDKQHHGSGHEGARKDAEQGRAQQDHPRLWRITSFQPACGNHSRPAPPPAPAATSPAPHQKATSFEARGGPCGEPAPRSPAPRRRAAPSRVAKRGEAATHGSCPGDGWAGDGSVVHGASPKSPASARRRPAARSRPPPPRAGVAVALRCDGVENAGALLKNTDVTFRIRKVRHYYTFNTFSKFTSEEGQMSLRRPLRGAWWRPESRSRWDPTQVAS